MIKVIGLIRRKPGISREQFLRHWKEEHGPLVMSIPELARHVRKYVQVHRVSIPELDAQERYQQQSLPADYDGVVEMWFDSVEEMQKAFNVLADPVICKRLREDEDSFIDGKSSLSVMVGEEFTISDRK
jgi:uncharacterized protein (TIGR02118 family)